MQVAVVVAEEMLLSVAVVSSKEQQFPVLQLRDDTARKRELYSRHCVVLRPRI